MLWGIGVFKRDFGPRGRVQARREAFRFREFPPEPGERRCLSRRRRRPRVAAGVRLTAVSSLGIKGNTGLDRVHARLNIKPSPGASRRPLPEGEVCAAGYYM